MRKKIPLFILLFWTAAIAYFIWQRVNQSDRPPIYDALTYYAKAKFSWMNIQQGFPENPLNVMPAVRPPGTVLLTYPFGFHDDYHGFLFRSVFVPFLLWIITILILTWPKREPNKEESYWPVAIAAMLLGPFPFFFQFDFGSSGYWGLVDSFLASVSALALALVLKSIEKKSKKLLLASIIVSSICPFIKPAGCFIFFLIALYWSVMTLLRVVNKNNNEKKALLKFWVLGSTLFFLAGIAILYAAVSSDYLGEGTVSYFAKSMIILKEETKGLASFPVLVSIFYNLVGPQILLYTSIFIFLFSKSTKNLESPIRPRTLFFSGFTLIIIGIWFWVWKTGISQVRYFYPFLLMGNVPFLYGAFDIFYRRNIKVYTIFKMACFLPAINILLLLSIVNPNKTWQDRSGVSMNINTNDPGVKVAKQFLPIIANEKVTATVYDTNMGNSNNSFISFGSLNQLIHPEATNFTAIHPVDWARPSTYRFTEIILNCEYIIFHPMDQDELSTALNDSIITSFYEEGIAIEAYLNSLTNAQGLQTLFEEGDCKLSKITDKAKLIEAFEPFLMSRVWRPLFMQENNITPEGWQLFQLQHKGLPKVFTRDTTTR
ncbi:MAG: hypothetical protein ABI761_02820 [Saprospiraceae bacterium]